MAVRRMFSKTIMLTDKFFDMSAKAQLLYYNLNFEADDDGFISNPKRLVKSLDATLRQYNELIANGYIISFESGVAVIAHWRVHNQIRKDRYTPTVCREEMEQLTVDENNVYIMATKRQPTVAKTSPDTATQVRSGKDSIGQVSIGEVRESKREERINDRVCAVSPTVTDNTRSYKGLSAPTPAKKPRGEFKNVILTEAEYKLLSTEYPNIDRTIERLSQYMAASGKKYLYDILEIKKKRSRCCQE